MTDIQMMSRLPIRTRGIANILALVGLSLVPVQAQTSAAESKLSFDVASVKQSKPGTRRGLTVERGRFTANVLLITYITFAYDLILSRDQMDAMVAHLPKWVSTDSFEIEALAQGNPSSGQVRLMVRSLLADRFKLQVHTVTAEAPVLAFILENPGVTGPRLRPHAQGAPCDANLSSKGAETEAVGVFPPACDQFVGIDKPHGAVLLASRNMTIGEIGAAVSSLGRLGRPVVDQTGLSGRFDFTLEFTPESKGNPPAPPSDTQPDLVTGTTLQEAVHEQLGLKLKATKAPLDMLVVDQVERPSEN